MNKILKHLHEREVNTNLYNPIIDKNSVNFPLWNLSEQLIGYLQYKPFQPKKTLN